MKIDPETRHQNLAQHVKQQLEFIFVEDVKSSVITFVFVMYDVPLLLGLLSIFKHEFLWIVSPFILIVHLWGIRLVIKNPYSTQFEMVLFMGILGLFGAISLFIMVQGMSYYTLHITSVFYYIIINLTTILLAYIFVKYQIDKYAGDPTKEKKWKPVKIYGCINHRPSNRIYIGTKCTRNDYFKTCYLINRYILLCYSFYVCGSKVFTSVLFYESEYGLCKLSSIFQQGKEKTY